VTAATPAVVRQGQEVASGFAGEGDGGGWEGYAEKGGAAHGFYRGGA